MSEQDSSKLKRGSSPSLKKIVSILGSDGEMREKEVGSNSSRLSRSLSFKEEQTNLSPRDSNPKLKRSLSQKGSIRWKVEKLEQEINSNSDNNKEKQENVITSDGSEAKDELKTSQGRKIGDRRSGSDQNDSNREKRAQFSSSLCTESLSSSSLVNNTTNSNNNSNSNINQPQRGTFARENSGGASLPLSRDNSTKGSSDSKLGIKDKALPPLPERSSSTRLIPSLLSSSSTQSSLPIQSPSIQPLPIQPSLQSNDSQDVTFKLLVTPDGEKDSIQDSKEKPQGLFQSLALLSPRYDDNLEYGTEFTLDDFNHLPDRTDLGENKLECELGQSDSINVGTKISSSSSQRFEFNHRKGLGRRNEPLATNDQFIIDNNDGIRIEKPSINLSNVTINVKEDIYRKQFYHERHYNFILQENESDAEYLNGKHYILSVLEKADVIDGHELHYALKTTAMGSEVMLLRLVPGSKENLVDRITLYLKETLIHVNHESSYYVTQKDFQDRVLSIEQRFVQGQSQMKVALLYIKKSQNSPEQWFANQGEDISTSFWDFLNSISTKIDDMANHNGYKGDVPKGVCYYNNWKPTSRPDRYIECIFHVAPIMNAEEIRRLIGNDIVVILFLEEGSVFDPSNVAELGAIPQIYVVVQPVKSNWRIAFFSNQSIIDYEPSPPITLLDSLETLIELVLTKLYNGLVATLYSKPLNRLFYTPRSVFIESNCKAYPRTNPAIKHGTMKVKDRDTTNPTGPLSPSSFVSTLSFRLIGSKDLRNNEPVMRCFAVITLRSATPTNKKTKAIASQFPLWNSDFTLGYRSFPLLSKTGGPTNVPQWINIYDKKYAVMNDSEIKISGQIFLAYELKH